MQVYQQPTVAELQHMREAPLIMHSGTRQMEVEAQVAWQGVGTTLASPTAQGQG
jgi:hypothetical protein